MKTHMAPSVHQNNTDCSLSDKKTLEYVSLLCLISMFYSHSFEDEQLPVTS